MESRSRLVPLALVLVMGAVACRADGAPSEVTSGGPSATESGTGRVVGAPVDIGDSTTESPSGSDSQLGPPVVHADWAAYEFEGVVQNSEVVVVGVIDSVDLVTKWSTPDGALEPTYSSGDMPGGLPEEWQEITVTVDQVLTDTRDVVSIEPLVVAYQVTQPGYEQIGISHEGGQILVAAFFQRVGYTDGSIVERLTLDPQATYLATDTGTMARLFSVADGTYLSARVGGTGSGCSIADLVDLEELVARATNPDSDRTHWLGYGDTAFFCPESNVEPDPEAEAIIP